MSDSLAEACTATLREVVHVVSVLCSRIMSVTRSYGNRMDGLGTWAVINCLFLSFGKYL